MSWLASLPGGVLVVGWLAFTLGIAALSRSLVRAVVPPDERDQVHAVAGPLMPALGATFAVLMALTLTSEAGYLRSAQDLVSTEAAQSSRLAWAATSPSVESAPIHARLLEYLRATRTHEWHGAHAAHGDDAATAPAIARLERVVREQSSRAEIGTPASTELLASLDAVTSGRRDRLAAASRQIPVLYVLTIMASGIALVMNAGALAFRSSRRSAWLVGGLAIVVGLSLALLFALSGPWQGPLTVSGHPIDMVAHDLQAGFFR